jgi:acyl-CoA dehydrogenase
MGFIEETGAAQYIRDARITTIYEGTTGIQSNDLIGRKIGRDGGAAMNQLIADMSRELQDLETSVPAASATRKAALEAVGLLKDSTDALVKALASRPDTAMAVSVPYLMLCGYVIGGWLTARAAAIAARNLKGQDRSFYESKLHTARFYADQVLPNALALARVVQGGAESVVDTDAALI